MAIDLNGYIALPKSNEFQPAFSHVVSDVVVQLNSCFPELIHSLYVYGSVAEGRAVRGRSDLDMTVIFNHAPNPAITVQLAAVQAELEKNNPIVSKIDFDCGLLQQVLHPNNKLSWGYWLKHHCVCVFGEDLSHRFEPFKPSKAIALAVNGDFMSVLSRLITQIKASTDLKRQLQFQRAAARKAIRATSILRREHDNDWPETLKEHCIKFNARYPALADDMDYLLTISTKPQGNFTDFNTRLIAFANWLDMEFHTLQS
ncbi:nucleotidyltransferase domain-containing protein [Xenorhabdus sp. 12]|uniref:Nucleotidyltransferase domain-containing protein n=1 Tax=Xenorhabdus santafensis TaxID=2582833 RepID=A0ABU4S3Q2_9GAMM|nr:nucleotidyltransferase domain-containing protein [Xenorhabdus sp. 12]MDX7985841.1 nucleotidyltransferase domain-containing protein [Xenorhabdus sp. 12]